MRKVTLLLVAVLLSLAAGAQTKQLPVPQGGERAASQAPRRAGLETVTPPEDLVAETYRMNTYMYVSSWTEVSRQVRIGFADNDVYLQGFSYFFPEAWIKGTLSEDHSTVTFPVQYLGDMQNTQGVMRNVYFCPFTYSEDGKSRVVIDAVFSYNEETRTFVLQQDVVTYIFEATSPDAASYFAAYDSFISISYDADVVEVPAGLETTTYQITGYDMTTEDEDMNEWEVVEEYVGMVNVGVKDGVVYVQGLCPFLKEAWAKGTRTGNTITFEPGQYFGAYVYRSKGYPMFLWGYNAETHEDGSFVLEYDEETESFVAQNWLAISALADENLMYNVYSGVVLAPIPDVAATPGTPAIGYYEYDSDYEMGMVELKIPTVSTDGAPLITDKLAYQLLVDYGDGPETYVFEADWHEGLAEDMTIVPYNFEDNIDFLKGGEMVLLYAIEEGLLRIGVQSIYTGGDETNLSEIGWYVVDDTVDGIAQATAGDRPATIYFDLQGRRVDKDTKGLLLRQTSTADGQVRTVKVMRR